MACCTVAGQGAGIAAALSVRAKRPLDRMDIATVQRELDHPGVRYR
jgi:hypothetical protein